MRNKNITVFLIILALAIIPMVESATESDLYYKTYNPSDCVIRVRNDATLSMQEYPISSKISLSGYNIIQTFDGRPNLPITYSSTVGESFNCQNLGLTYDYPGFWELVKNGYVQYNLEYCPFGASDPNSNDGIINYKCNGLCHPNMAVCSNSLTVKKCSSDGNSITTTTCEYQCSNGGCLSRDYNIFINVDKASYEFGDSVLVSGQVIQSNPLTPLSGVSVTAQVLKSGSVIKESRKTTDSLGNVAINLTDVQLVGDVEIKLTATYQSKTLSVSKIVTFAGEPVNYKVTTYSYTQYDSNPIKFLVELKDTSGGYIYPEKISGITVVSSLSNGVISSNSVTYQGNGVYEVLSYTNGVGTYTGKLQFNYQGTVQSSPIISINVEKMVISIDTSKISSSAYLNDNKNFTIKLFDSEGDKLNPDNIQIKVSFPDGTTEDTISFTEMHKVGDGEYTFPFYFQQVEKYTFDILVDKAGYVRGSAKVIVAVGAHSDTDALPGWFANLPYIVIGSIVAFFILSYIIYKWRKR